MSDIPTVHDREKTYISDERRLSDAPLVRREKENVGTGRVRLVTLTRVDGLLLDGLNLEWLEFWVEHLTLGMTRMLILGAID